MKKGKLFLKERSLCLILTDPPVIRLLGAPQVDLEEGKDFLILRCEADANPRAGIVWRRVGRPDIVGLQETMQLRPVGRRDAGLYTCQGQNNVGNSETLSVQVDVKCKKKLFCQVVFCFSSPVPLHHCLSIDPPRVLSVGPDKLSTAVLYGTVTLECIAEGNPPPTFKWTQRWVMDRFSESTF